MKRRIAAIAGLMILAALVEHSMGRRLWGISGEPGLWSGDINSSHNSQYLLDPYTFTHVTHGVFFYGVTSLLMRSCPVSTRLVTAVALESGWEVLENSDLVIQRYRAETISLDYYGDSIVNSMADIMASMLGFLIAARVPKRATIIGTIAVEVILALWIRDNLTLNIIMLLHPSHTIRTWQLRP